MSPKRRFRTSAQFFQATQSTDSSPCSPRWPKDMIIALFTPLEAVRKSGPARHTGNIRMHSSAGNDRMTSSAGLPPAPTIRAPRARPARHHQSARQQSRGSRSGAGARASRGGAGSRPGCGRRPMSRGTRASRGDGYCQPGLRDELAGEAILGDFTEAESVPRQEPLARQVGGWRGPRQRNAVVRIPAHTVGCGPLPPDRPDDLGADAREHRHRPRSRPGPCPRR